MSEIKKIDTLIEKYPELFKRNNKSTLRFETFECGDGWYDILDTWSSLVVKSCKDHVKHDTPKSFKYRFVYYLKDKLNKYHNFFKKKNPKFDGKKFNQNDPYYVNRFIIGYIYSNLYSLVGKQYNKCYLEHVKITDNEKIVYPHVLIVKEKFGTLNIQGVEWEETPKYNSERLFAKIRSYEAFAESMSSKICETSGNKGFPCSNGGWYKTLSEEEITKQKYRKTKE